MSYISPDTTSINSLHPTPHSLSITSTISLLFSIPGLLSRIYISSCYCLLSKAIHPAATDAATDSSLFMSIVRSSSDVTCITSISSLSSRCCLCFIVTLSAKTIAILTRLFVGSSKKCRSLYKKTGGASSLFI